MSITETDISPLGESRRGNIHWGAAIAGALVATAVSLVLMTFGAAIGLAVASPSPSWRSASAGLALLSGLWVMVVAVGSFALGGYIAGRMRTRLTPASSDEIDFRDGMHGALAWAIAAILGGLILMAEVRMLTPADTAAPATVTGATAEPKLLASEIDRLLRGDRRPADVDVGVTRGEVGRLLSGSLNESTFAAEDRAYLIRLVAAHTALSPADAERRVDAVVTKARQQANRARRSGVVSAFMAAASLALGFAAAWFAAGAGGRHRDGDTVPSLASPLRRPQRTIP